MADRVRVILVIDDDETVLNQVSNILKESGFQPVTASNGLDGLKQLGSSTVEMIILDVNMPELDGMQTCRLVRANEKHRNTPILMLTARGDITDMMEARKMGADDYLVKPLDSNTLLRKIERLITR
ncbi:MAG: hypothetical protein C5B54_02100 [Acidobacteria bacterium]|nr:MAG: hypothetical protein C5B54_02100 [Acidobacteriota bacterium]